MPGPDDLNTAFWKFVIFHTFRWFITLVDSISYFPILGA